MRFELVLFCQNIKEIPKVKLVDALHLARGIEVALSLDFFVLSLWLHECSTL